MKTPKKHKRSNKSKKKQITLKTHTPKTKIIVGNYIPKSDYQLINVQDNIYKIVVNSDPPCVKFFYKPLNSVSAFIVFNNEQYILLNYDDVDLIEQENVSNDCLEYMSKLNNTTGRLKFEKRRAFIKYLNQHNIDYVNISGDCFKAIDLTNAQLQLQMLNNLLQRKCKLELKLDYFFNLPGKISRYGDNITYLLLCLYNESECISSLELIIKNTTITINSKTNQHYEGRKYNKLLRSVAIIISRHLSSKLTQMESYAINPTSAWLMIKYLNSRIGEINESFYAFLKVDDPDVIAEDRTKKIIFDFYKTVKDAELLLIVDLNDFNVENAEMVFNQVLTDIVCD
jgi:hypothetical protein